MPELLFNPNCSFCTETHDIPLGSWWSDPKVEERFLPSDGLKPGWRLDLWFHGRREQTVVHKHHIQLQGASQTSRGELHIAGHVCNNVSETKELVQIVGSVADPTHVDSPNLIKPGVWTDHFLVFRRKDGANVLLVLPLVHMINCFARVS